jgi:hypothetical protein
LAIGMLAMALAGLNSVGRQDQTTEVVSSATASIAQAVRLHRGRRPQNEC